MRLAALLLALLFAASAHAHGQGRSFSDVRLFPDKISYFLDVAPEDLALFQRFDTSDDGKIDGAEIGVAREAIFSVITDRVHLTSDGARCRPTLRDVTLDEGTGLLSVHAIYGCAGTGKVAIDVTLLEELGPLHHHYVRVVRPSGHLDQHVLSAAHHDFAVEGESTLAHTVAEFLLLGLEHIATGYDHILFVLGLLVVARKLRQIIGVVTAFTLAHTVTLLSASLLPAGTDMGRVIAAAVIVAIVLVAFEALAAKVPRAGVRALVAGALGAATGALFVVLGPMRNPLVLVEALIAASVTFVALENLALGEIGRRWVLAFGFGLVHGFGFASVLSEQELPTQARVVALVCFNLGVELGQVTLVAAAFPAVAWLARDEQRRRRGVLAVSVVIAACGFVWLVERLSEAFAGVS